MTPITSVILQVELRAFCSKHSLANPKLPRLGNPASFAHVNTHLEIQNESTSSGYCFENGENGGTQLDTQKKSVEANSKRLRDVVQPVTRARARYMSESSDQEFGQMEKPDSVTCPEEDSADSLNFVLILKKV